jgi:dipeptide transport system substrate-binding protein
VAGWFGQLAAEEEARVINRIGHQLLAGIVIATLSGAAEAKMLTFCAKGSPEGFDPAPYTAAATFDATGPLYDRLVAFREGTTEVAPALAESIDISADGREYTLRLRPGVRFHATEWFTPTRDMNADDVIFSIGRQWDEGHPYHSYAGGGWPAFNGMSLPALVKDIRKADERTVVFVLDRPDAQFPADLAMDFASILSAEYAELLLAEGTPELLDSRPIGTGPFRFVGYNPDAGIRYAAHADYWRGRPPIDELNFMISPDSGVRRQQMAAGDCQVMTDPNPADIAEMLTDPAVRLIQRAAPDIAYLAYNTMRPPFDDPRVRRALNLAIDKRALVETLFGGAGIVAKGPLSPSVWASDPALADDPYDPDAALRLLAEAGVFGLTVKLWPMPMQRPYNPDAIRMAELIGDDLAAIGIKTDIVRLDRDEFLELATATDRDAAVLFGWTGDNGDPANILPVLLGCDGVGSTNLAHWCDRGFDRAVNEAGTISDPNERAALYRQAQAIFREAAPWLPIAHSVATAAVAATVEGVTMDPLGRLGFGSADIAE